jgi:hypothetical protein
MCGYITKKKTHKQQTQVTRNRENVRFHNTRKHEFRKRKQRNLGLGRVKLVTSGGYVTYARAENGPNLNVRTEGEN